MMISSIFPFHKNSPLNLGSTNPNYGWEKENILKGQLFQKVENGRKVLIDVENFKFWPYFRFVMSPVTVQSLLLIR